MALASVSSILEIPWALHGPAWTSEPDARASPDVRGQARGWQDRQGGSNEARRPASEQRCSQLGAPPPFPPCWMWPCEPRSVWEAPRILAGVKHSANPRLPWTQRKPESGHPDAEPAPARQTLT